MTGELKKQRCRSKKSSQKLVLHHLCTGVCSIHLGGSRIGQKKLTRRYSGMQTGDELETHFCMGEFLPQLMRPTYPQSISSVAVRSSCTAGTLSAGAAFEYYCRSSDQPENLLVKATIKSMNTAIKQILFRHSLKMLLTLSSLSFPVNKLRYHKFGLGLSVITI